MRRALKRHYGRPLAARLERGGIDMYAVITTGGKQYKVEKDEIIRVEKLEAEGNTVILPVNMISDNGELTIGSPIIDGASVKAEIIREGKERKIVVFKYKAKKNVRKRQGHRQPFTALKILEINK